MGKYSLLTCLLSIVSLLDVSVSNAEPCQAPNTAYSGIYTCVDPAIVLADPAIQCDPETCLWNLDLFNPEQPPEPCLAILLLEQQIANLPDLLEPCLWWEMLHGDLGYLLPEELPSAVASPSPSPLPTFIESNTPSFGFTMTPSSPLLGTSLPTVSSSQTPAPSSSEVDATSSPTRVRRLSVPLQSMLLTFVFERYSGFRLRSRYLSEKGLLATDESYDAMVKVTEEHIIANIPDLIDIELIISRVDRGESSNEKMETLVLMGTLYFTAEAATADILPDLSPASVRRQVEDVFDNNVSVLRYIHALRKSDQAAFNDIVLVYPGIVSPNSQIQGSTSNEDESFWKSFFFNWENPVWIVVAAGISAAVLGLCAVFSFTCYLRSEHRRGLDHQHLATRKSDDTSKTAGERNPYNVEDSVHDDENSVNGPGDMSEIGYQASEVTSVYSYIDNNNTMMDDQSFSVAPSYTFPGTEYDDNRSVLWSVIDDAKDNDILDDLDSTAGASPPSRQKTGYTSRMGVPERQSSEDSDDDMFSLLSRNNDRTQVLETNATNESVLQGSPPTPQNVISSQKTHAAVDDAISKHSPDSSSGASHASRESLNKISNMIPGFRSKRNNVKTSSNYQQLDESYGSHHSWDKELGIQPSPDDLDDESVFLDDSEEGETIVSQLAPLSSIHKISSGGDKEDSDVPLNETAKSRDDDSSVESGDLQEGHLAPAQFIVPVSESAETGFLGTKSEDTTHSDGKDSNSSEKENISSDALPDGESNNFDCSFSEAEISPENNNEKPEQRRSDDTNAPPLAEKPECSHNFNNSDNRDDAANPVIVMASKEKSDMDWSPNKEQVQEAPTDITDDEPTNPVNEEEVPAINTLASF